eukprot:7327655-Prymnesium_polylepis.1
MGAVRATAAAPVHAHPGCACRRPCVAARARWRSPSGSAARASHALGGAGRPRGRTLDALVDRRFQYLGKESTRSPSRGGRGTDPY